MPSPEEVARQGQQYNDFLLAQPFSQAGGFPQVFNLGGGMGSVVGFTVANPAGGNNLLAPYFSSHVSGLPGFNPNATPVQRPDTTASPRPGSFGHTGPSLGQPTIPPQFFLPNPSAMGTSGIFNRFPFGGGGGPPGGLGLGIGGMGGGGGPGFGFVNRIPGGIAGLYNATGGVLTQDAFTAALLGGSPAFGVSPGVGATGVGSPLVPGGPPNSFFSLPSSRGGFPSLGFGGGGAGPPQGAGGQPGTGGGGDRFGESFLTPFGPGGIDRSQIAAASSGQGFQRGGTQSGDFYRGYSHFQPQRQLQGFQKGRTQPGAGGFDFYRGYSHFQPQRQLQSGDFYRGYSRSQPQPQLQGVAQTTQPGAGGGQQLPEGQRLNQQAGVPPGVAGGFLTSQEDVDFLIQNGLIRPEQVETLRQVAAKNQQVGQAYAQDIIGDRTVGGAGAPQGGRQRPNQQAGVPPVTGGFMMSQEDEDFFLQNGLIQRPEQAGGAGAPQGGPELQGIAQQVQPGQPAPQPQGAPPGQPQPQGGGGFRGPAGGIAPGGGFTRLPGFNGATGAGGFSPSFDPFVFPPTLAGAPLTGQPLLGNPPGSLTFNTRPVSAGLIGSGFLDQIAPGFSGSLPPGFAGFDPGSRANFFNEAAGIFGNDPARLPGKSAGPLLGFGANLTFNLAAEQARRNALAEQEVRNASALQAANPGNFGTSGLLTELAFNPFTTSGPALQGEIEGIISRGIARAREGALQGLTDRQAGSGVLGGESDLLRAGVDFGSRAAEADALAKARVDQALRRQTDIREGISGLGAGSRSLLESRFQPQLLGAGATAQGLANPFTASGIEQVRDLGRLSIQDEIFQRILEQSSAGALLGAGTGLLGGIFGGL